MTCGSDPTTLGGEVECLDGAGATAAAKDEGFASAAPSDADPLAGMGSRDGGQSIADADGGRLLVLCACVIAFLLFLYIIGQYIRQRRRARSAPQNPVEEQELELPQRVVTMYEVLGDEATDCAASPSDGPVLVMNVGSSTGGQGHAVAIGVPDLSSQGSSSGDAL